MATSPNKTLQSALLAWADIAAAAGTMNMGAAFDVSTKWAAAVGVRLGRQSGTPFTAGWPNIRIEASTKASGNNSWIPIWTYQMQLGASLANTTLNGAILANASTFVVTAATNITDGDLLYLKDTSTANYELIRVASVSGTTVTPEDNVVNAHANASQVTDQAEEVWAALDVSMYTRIRAVVDNSGSAQAFAAEISLITMDSFG